MPDDDLPKLTGPGFWTARDCVMLPGVFVSMISIATGVPFAWHNDTDGLLLERSSCSAGISDPQRAPGA